MLALIFNSINGRHAMSDSFFPVDPDVLNESDLEVIESDLIDMSLIEEME